jgi:hypothetical protein
MKGQDLPTKDTKRAKKEELFLILFSFSFLSRVSWAERDIFKQLLRYRLRGVAHDEVEGAGRDLAKTPVAI